ncbi:MAG: hypothetical protein SFX18_06885 [Pirellulales bacterium]|nr:hypothetical protein [Pirellulales bacterium]
MIFATMLKAENTRKRLAELAQVEGGNELQWDLSHIAPMPSELVLKAIRESGTWAEFEAGREKTKERAQDAIRNRDAKSLLCLMANHHNLDFVYRNIRPLWQQGMYETALIDALVAPRTNNSSFTLGMKLWMLELGGREKLLAAGDALPPGETFTLYRGVAGTTRERQVRGVSWTDDLETAKWFAGRFPYLANPAVYETTVTPAEIYCFINDREEREYICVAQKYRKLKFTPEQLHESFLETNERRRQENIASKSVE